jgi:hypothetical protein
MYMAFFRAVMADRSASGMASSSFSLLVLRFLGAVLGSSAGAASFSVSALRFTAAAFAFVLPTAPLVSTLTSTSTSTSL